MLAWALLALCYLAGGLTLLHALMQIEHLGVELGAPDPASGEKYQPRLQRSRGARCVLVALWPWWAYTWWRAQ